MLQRFMYSSKWQRGREVMPEHPARRIRHRDTFQAIEHGDDDAIATFTIRELERVRGGKIDVPGQGLAQQRPRAECARAHRRSRNVEAFRRFLHRHLLDVAEDEHRAELGRQLVDPALQQLTQLGAHRRGIRCSADASAIASSRLSDSPWPAAANGTTTAVRLRLRNRPSASLMTMRASQVESFAPPWNEPMFR
jgi:hypothetical protein